MLIYLTAPYRHKNISVINTRRIKISEKTTELINDGHIVFSPALFNNVVNNNSSYKLSLKKWHSHNLEIMKLCSKLIVLCLDKWEYSKYIIMEISLAENLNIPIEYMDP